MQANYAGKRAARLSLSLVLSWGWNGWEAKKKKFLIILTQFVCSFYEFSSSSSLNCFILDDSKGMRKEKSSLNANSCALSTFRCYHQFCECFYKQKRTTRTYSSTTKAHHPSSSPGCLENTGSHESFRDIVTLKKFYLMLSHLQQFVTIVPSPPPLSMFVSSLSRKTASEMCHKQQKIYWDGIESALVIFEIKLLPAVDA